ncbi:MAG: Uma2 family endonuclease [Lachnospiraceae bacterium]|nr:Uma2 family endonuclease [Lachnospiraceae bacterium]
MDNIPEMSNMYPEHRFVMDNLRDQILGYIKSSNCVIMREAKYKWPEYDECFEPDISLLCGVRHRKKLNYTDVPRFIAEVLSDSTEKNDREHKMEAYAKVGVQEYWLVDWRKPYGAVERYMLDDSGENYILHDIVNGNEPGDVKINILSFPHVVFSMGDLMKHVGEDIEE